LPRYEFACDCGHEQEVIWPMGRFGELLKCSKCGGQMYRKYNFRTGNKDYSKPIVSDSLAINPDQIPEHRKHFPDVEVLPDGRPVFDKFSKHENYLKKTGFKKHRQKIKPKGERIA